MDNVQLLGHLLEQLPQIKDYLRKHMTDEFEQLQSSCDQFSKYCKDIKMWKSSCSDIYHDELVAIFEAIEGIKSATSNDSVTLCDITTLLNNLRSALNVDFYDGHVIIQGTEEPAEEIEEIEIKSYVDKGRYLKDSEITLKLKNELNAVSLYYSALVGPSLMGKTQTAFTLSHHMTVFYVNCAGSKTEQVICCAMRPIYKLFNGAVSEDRNDSRYDFERNLGTGFFLKEKFKNYKWKTLGLIFTLLKWKSIHPQLDDPEAWFKSFWDIESVVLKPLSVDIFKFKMQENGFLLKDCLVFCDEMSKYCNGFSVTILFLRNICMVVGIPTILSGIVSIAENSMDGSDIQYAALSMEKPWMNVVKETPCFNLGSIALKARNGTIQLAHYIENVKYNMMVY